MREIDAWGAPNRHYSRREVDGFLGKSKHWEHAIETLAPKCHATVERTVKSWNRKIRHRLNDEIGFQLGGRSVPIKVVDGLPGPLPILLDHDDGLAHLVLNQSLLRGVIEGTRFMDSVWKDVRNYMRGPLGPASRSEIKKVEQTAQAWLDLATRHNLVETMREIEEDVLGAYFYKVPEIRIYWLAIGIFSALLNVPIEALTFVVLTHELAHAYTHLGLDIDSFDWPTTRFALTDVAIIEGLAQFYTEVICDDLRLQVPEAIATFEILLKHQNEIYATHRKWVRRDDRKSGEIVRVSLLECRRSGRQMHRADFATTVKRRREEITGSY